MIKTWILLLSSWVILFLTGCDSDDTTSIHGAWNAESMLVMFEGGGFVEADLPESWTEELVLNEDGTYTYSWSKDGRSGSGNGTWERTDGQLTLNESNRNEQITANLSGNTLSLITGVPEGEAELVFRKP